MVNFIQITKSRLRRKILSLFYTNPTANLYLREIASTLKEDAGNLSKEFFRLEKEGIFISATRGNQKYLYLNKNYPLYRELKSIVFKTIGVEGALKERISKIKGIELAFIYGSFAANRESAASDIDLLVVGSPDEDKLIQEIEALEKALRREINYNIYPASEFKAKAKRGGSFIQNILKRPKILLKGKLNGI